MNIDTGLLYDIGGVLDSVTGVSLRAFIQPDGLKIIAGDDSGVYAWHLIAWEPIAQARFPLVLMRRAISNCVEDLRRAVEAHDNMPTKEDTIH